MLGARRVHNPYKKVSSTFTTPTSAKRGLLFLLILLCLLFFLIKWFNSAADLRQDVHIQNPPPAPSRPKHKPELKQEVWTSINQYDVIKGICYLDYEVSHVNNRRADHDSCFAACLGYNQAHATDLCIGWTSTRSSVSGTETCILRSKLDDATKVHSESCISARMWKSAIKPGKTEDEQAQDLHSRSPSQRGGKKAGEKRLRGDDLPARTDLCGENPFTKKRPMRVFVACMQASGCTLLSYLLGQKNNTAVILDMGVRQNIPKRAYFAKANHAYPTVDMIVLKASVRSYASKDPLRWLQKVEEMFSPDYSILFMRHPVDALLHLATHIGGNFPGGLPEDAYANCNSRQSTDFSYGLRCGTPVSKLKALNRLFAKREGRFQSVVTYEDLCQHRELFVQALRDDGVCLTNDLVQRPQKSIMEMMQFSFRYFPSVHQNRDVPPSAIFWGAGHLANTFHTVEGDAVSSDETYSQCVIDDVLARRKKLLKRAKEPYRSKSLEKIDKMVRNAAPDILKYYESVQRYRDIFIGLESNKPSEESKETEGEGVGADQEVDTTAKSSEEEDKGKTGFSKTAEEANGEEKKEGGQAKEVNVSKQNSHETPSEEVTQAEAEAETKTKESETEIKNEKATPAPTVANATEG